MVDERKQLWQVYRTIPAPARSWILGAHIGTGQRRGRDMNGIPSASCETTMELLADGAEAVQSFRVSPQLLPAHILYTAMGVRIMACAIPRHDSARY